MILSSKRTSRSTKTTYFSEEISSLPSRGNSLPNNNSKLTHKQHHTLSSMISTIKKKKFLVQNKKALETYDRILKQIRQKKKIVITTPNKDISEKNSKFLLTSYDFNSITTNDKDSEKLKRMNRIKLKRFKSNVVGVDEGLIGLPQKEVETKTNDNQQGRNSIVKLNRLYDIDNINNYYSKQTSRKRIFCSPTQNTNVKKEQSLQYKNGISAFVSPRRSNKTINMNNTNYTMNYSSRQERQIHGRVSTVFSLYKNKTTSSSKIDPQMINEIKKLNQWDRKHAVNLHKASYRPSISMQVFLNSLNQSSLKWLMDIKADPKQLEILSRNKYLKDFFKKIEHEQKAISLQNTKLSKKDFDFGAFAQNNYSHRKVSSDGDEILAQVDVYREIMKERTKIEEMLKTDLSGIAQQLYELKTEKKSLVVDLYDTSNEVNELFKQMEQIKNEDQLKRQNLQEDINEEYENIIRKGKNDLKRKSTHRGKTKNDQKKDLLFMQKSRMLGSQTQLDHELHEKLQTLTDKKNILNIKINRLNEELDDVNENMRKIKMKLTQRLKALTNYYLDILSKGIDVRRSGISWVVIRLISLNAFLTYENFPVFLTHEQIDYVTKIAYMQHELNELINLFQILKKKQSDLREEQLHNQELLKKTQKEYISENDNDKSIKNLIKKIEGVAKKYEQVVKICLNEKKDDEHLNEICKALHKKIIELHRESELEEEEQQKKNYLNEFELFFLPGSLAKFFNENKKYRMYFDDIVYLNNEITKREKDLAVVKEQQLKLFRKQCKNSKNAFQNELIFAALFGNGISV